MAQEMKLLKLGTVCLDGTKSHANASRHSALSHGHIVKLQTQIELEVQELLALAEQADSANIPDGMNLPEELKLRKDRLDAMAAAKAKIAARAALRYAKEWAEFDAKMDKRAAKEKETGKKPSGRAPQAPAPGVRDTDQINLTDEESRIMPVSGGGFEQAYNAQAPVDAQTMLVVATGVTQVPNDKEQIEPMLQTLQAQAPQLGTAKTLIADTGYCSEKNILACEQANIVPLIAVAREDHHPHWSDHHTEPAPLAQGATPVQTMAHSPEDLGRWRRLRLAQTNGGAGLWDHQVGDGFSSVFDARIEQGDRGVEPGVSGLECEAHGRTSSENSLKGMALTLPPSHDHGV